MPRNCLKICAKTCPETASKSVQTQQYGPALMVAVPFLGFRALDSLEIVPFMHLLLLSSLQAAPWNSSPLKLLLGIRASHQKLSSWINRAQMKSQRFYLPY